MVLGDAGYHVWIQPLWLGAVAVVQNAVAITLSNIGLTAAAGRQQGDCGNQHYQECSDSHN